MIRSTLWAADTAPAGPPLFAVEEIHRHRAVLIEAAMGNDAELVEPRFRRGCRCYAVLIDGRIAGYGWLTVGPEWIGELQLEIRPRKAEGYVWNCVTLPEHRRKGIFRSLLVGITDAARQIGVRRVWIGSLDLPAVRALEPTGFRPAVRFRILKFAGLLTISARFDDSKLGQEARGVLPDLRGWSTRGVARRRH